MVRWFVQVLRDTAAALERWLTPEPEYVTQEQLTVILQENAQLHVRVTTLSSKVDALKEEIEKLSLYTGLRRPIQTVVGRK